MPRHQRFSQAKTYGSLELEHSNAGGGEVVEKTLPELQVLHDAVVLLSGAGFVNQALRLVDVQVVDVEVFGFPDGIDELLFGGVVCGNLYALRFGDAKDAFVGQQCEGLFDRSLRRQQRPCALERWNGTLPSKGSAACPSLRIRQPSRAASQSPAFSGLLVFRTECLRRRQGLSGHPCEGRKVCLPCSCRSAASSPLPAPLKFRNLSVFRAGSMGTCGGSKQASVIRSSGMAKP